MPLFLARRPSADYEENDAVVVRAADEDAARRLAQGVDRRNAADWLDPTKSTCVPVPEAGPPAVILISNIGG